MYSGFQLFPLYLENYLRYEKILYKSFTTKLAVFIRVFKTIIYQFFVKIFGKKLLNNYSKKISLTWVNRGNFIVKLLCKTFFYISNSFRDISEKLKIVTAGAPHMKQRDIIFPEYPFHWNKNLEFRIVAAVLRCIHSYTRHI